MEQNLVSICTPTAGNILQHFPLFYSVSLFLMLVVLNYIAFTTHQWGLKNCLQTFRSLRVMEPVLALKKKKTHEHTHKEIESRYWSFAWQPTKPTTPREPERLSEPAWYLSLECQLCPCSRELQAQSHQCLPYRYNGSNCHEK